MRISYGVNDGNLRELDVQVLINRVQRATKDDIVLEFDGDLLPDERLEERMEKLWKLCCCFARMEYVRIALSDKNRDAIV